MVHPRASSSNGSKERPRHGGDGRGLPLPREPRGGRQPHRGSRERSNRSNFRLISRNPCRSQAIASRPTPPQSIRRSWPSGPRGLRRQARACVSADHLSASRSFPVGARRFSPAVTRTKPAGYLDLEARDAAEAAFAKVLPDMPAIEVSKEVARAIAHARASTPTGSGRGTLREGSARSRSCQGDDRRKVVGSSDHANPDPELDMRTLLAFAIFTGGIWAIDAPSDAAPKYKRGAKHSHSAPRYSRKSGRVRAREARRPHRSLPGLSMLGTRGAQPQGRRPEPAITPWARVAGTPASASVSSMRPPWQQNPERPAGAVRVTHSSPSLPWSRRASSAKARSRSSAVPTSPAAPLSRRRLSTRPCAVTG